MKKKIHCHFVQKYFVSIGSSVIGKKPILITYHSLKSSKSLLLSMHSKGREHRGRMIKLSGRNT